MSHKMSTAAATTAATAALADSLVATLNQNSKAALSTTSAEEALAKLLTQATIPFENRPAASRGLIGWMLYFIASVILFVTRTFFWALSFATITIPTLIFKILSFSLTLTLNFSSLYVSLEGGC